MSLLSTKFSKNSGSFLPKSKYVAYTVTPYNLIPACSDCNTGKLDSTFHNRVEEPFHPYYDNFDDCVWLKAKLIEMEPVSFQFMQIHQLIYLKRKDSEYVIRFLNKDFA